MDELHRKIWAYKRMGYSSGEVAAVLNEDLVKVNILYVKPLPMDPEEREYYRRDGKPPVRTYFPRQNYHDVCDTQPVIEESKSV